ncbi:RNA polymerase I, largest subunit [Pelomyxa schiedti]|nr:RNA polymerase I, largest subunit [Pelomyxa schiedti]
MSATAKPITAPPAVGPAPPAATSTTTPGRTIGAVQRSIEYASERWSMGASQALVPECEVNGVSFRFLTAKEVKALSVKRIHEPVSYNRNGDPNPGGLYDPVLGPQDHSSPCATCGLLSRFCPGHYGHIELAEPLYNPILYMDLLYMLRSSCWHCKSLRATDAELLAIRAQLQFVSRGELFKAYQLHDLLEGNPLLANQKASAANLKTQLVQTAAEEGKSNDNHYASMHLLQLKTSLKKGFLAKLRANALKPCPNCTKKTDPFKTDQERSKLFMEDQEGKEKTTGTAKTKTKTKTKTKNKSNIESGSEGEEKAPGIFRTFIFPALVRKHINQVWSRTKLQQDVLSLIYGPNPDLFFVDTLLVPPVRFRPSVSIGSSMAEHPQTAYFSKILTNNSLLTDPQWKHLKKQGIIMEMQKNYSDLLMTQDVKKPPSVRSILEHKQGLFRMHMMGKRVNYSARSVISPDPYIDTNQIGIPLFFAMKLTFPVPVTTLNYEKLRQMVENGPDIYPGANRIEDENGNIIELMGRSPRDEKLRQAQAKQLLTVSPNGLRRFKIVHRHVIDGDVLLVNRQPTLHKPSMMGHVARVLSKEKTLRLHYSNCSTYNADFDGDEMNVHLPQDPIARAETLLVAFTDEQYVVPKDGSPLRGLIQDWVVTGALLTKKDTFFTKSVFQQLVYGCLYNINQAHLIRTPPPAIYKPERLWTGKQIISVILEHITISKPPISLESNSKIPGSVWGKGGIDPLLRPPPNKDFPDMTKFWAGANESVVVVSSNELLCGVLDKSQFGASAYGLVHSCYELYGPTVAGVILSVLGRLFTKFLQLRGFTCGIDDLIMQPSVEKSRRELLDTANARGHVATCEFTGKAQTDSLGLKKALSEIRKDPGQSSKLDGKVKNETSKYTSSVIEQCIPDGQYKAFPANNLSLMTVSGARGSVVNFSQISCLLGQQELEGRRVPVMVSGKTLPSFAAYDSTARAGGFVMQRFLTGVQPQEFFFHSMAGREGLIDTAVKTARSGYLQRCIIKVMEALRVHYDYSVRDCDGSIVQFNYGEDAIDVLKSGFLYKYKFLAQNYDALVHNLNVTALRTNFSTAEMKKLTEEHELAAKDKANHLPILASHFAGQTLGVVSEKFFNSLNDYINNDPDKFFQGKIPKIIPRKFQGLMFLKYYRCLVSPGEAVGVLAGQSIGEPSTQMTLNTFHLAGRGDINVTLGMPRLRELIMFAKRNIETPTMTLKVKSNTEQDAEKLANLLTRVLLSDLVEDIEVVESIRKNFSDDELERNYTITISLVPEIQSLLEKHSISSPHFFLKLQEFKEFLEKEVQKKSGEKTQQSATMTVKVADEGGPDGPDEGDEETDGPSTKEILQEGKEKAKKKSRDKTTVDSGKRKKQSSKYGEDKDEDEDIEDINSEEDELERKTPSQPSEEETVEILSKVPPKRVAKALLLDWENPKFAITVKSALNKKLNMLSIVQQTCKKFVVSEVPRIKRASVVKKPGQQQEFCVMTDGVNLGALATLPFTDINSFVCNDICAILDMFGVEAARTSIVGEISAVFKAYGINVDYRHLSLIADYMTFLGEYRSFNRTGINISPSPILKMSFETTLEFLKKATLDGAKDTLRSPSGCIFVGRPFTHGTGCFDLVQDFTQKPPTATPPTTTDSSVKLETKT